MLPANKEQDSVHAHYYWWIKYWRFLLQITNHQSLLLANISSCMVPYSTIIGWEEIVVKSLPQRIGGEIFGEEIFGECHFK